MPTSRLLCCGAALALLVHSTVSEACGGFFCSQAPVDQTAERILFEVGADSVTMTTQISFSGDAADFAWVLPLNAVPDPESLSVFSQRALTTLGARSGPIFYEECDRVQGQSQGTVSPPEGGGNVTVHIRAEVDAYDVAVIESSDPAALSEWLQANGYRITAAMDPYIAMYTDEGMKFLALKLREAADVSELKPFRFTLPGTVPSIPLRMTSLAAEPEMSIVVWVLSDQRYEAKNWMNVDVDPAELRVVPDTQPLQTNWTSLVAREVDEAGGQAWVTEFAGSTDVFVDPLLTQVELGNFASAEDEEAAHLLLDAMQPHSYITRFYTRVSPEEMLIDPVFGRSSGGEVDGIYPLGTDNDCSVPSSTDPCDFVTCGAGGICRSVEVDDGAGGVTTVAGCGCVPGATARASAAPDGSISVICQDQRMSFVNPGDQEGGAETLPDPCATFDCGEHGSCLAMNMTPTCVCDTGYVAVASLEDGRGDTRCVAPSVPIDAGFYTLTLPDPTRFWPQTKPAGTSTTSSSADDSSPGDLGSGASCAVRPGPTGSLPPWWFAAACAGVGLACARRFRRRP